MTDSADNAAPTPAEVAGPANPPAPTSGPDAGRFSLNDHGVLLWQKDSSNPLPGEPVGRVVKGAAILQPAAQTDDAALQARAQEWLDIHVRQVLEPLFLLKAEGEGALAAAAGEIGTKLFEHLGVMHRGDLETEIAALDSDLRKSLRTRGVRLGPVLVFLPALVKPAAVRLRALLWALWNGKTLPIAQPADGRVSEVIDPAAIDRHFYRMIGYPVFGPRAIRIDMLDRVVTDIYDTADKGVFEAKHKYAEWLGTNLDGLHAILEAMGHRKLKVAAEDAPAAPVEGDIAPVEAVAEAPAEAEPATVAAVEAKAPPVVQKFFLKRGKMSERPQARHPRPQPSRKTEDKPETAEQPKREFKPKTAYDPNRPQGKKDRDSKGEDRPRKKFDKRDDRDREAKVYTFEGKKSDSDDNNPFAILKNYKK